MSITKRLQLDPPAPSPDEIRERIERQAEAPTAVAPDPRLQREYVFPFRFETKTRVLEGTFTNRILTVRDRMRSGILAGELLGGVRFETLPPTAQQLAVMVAWMTFSLQKEGRPDWAKDLAQIDDDLLIYALYGEVWAHQATFLGRPDDTEPKADPA